VLLKFRCNDAGGDVEEWHLPADWEGGAEVAVAVVVGEGLIGIQPSLHYPKGGGGEERRRQGNGMEIEIENKQMDKAVFVQRRREENSLRSKLRK
jgi:hypothetical protein